MLYNFLVIYFVIISFVSIFLTIYDKLAAIHSKRRIRERTLFIISIMGGSLLMYITMLSVRHKTRRKNFMIGIPAIILLQALFFYLILVSI